MIRIEHQLGRLNTALADYQRVTRLSLFDVLAKQAQNLTHHLRDRLETLTPPKGAIVAERMQALRHGNGIYVRPGLRESVMKKYGWASDLQTHRGGFVRGRKKPKIVGSLKRKGKHLNLQALSVQRELRLRESGRGFTPWAAQIRRLGDLPAKRTIRHLGRYRQELATAGIQFDASGGSVTLQWGATPPSEIGDSLAQPRAEAALSAALDDLTGDINIYLARQLAKATQTRIAQ